MLAYLDRTPPELPLPQRVALMGMRVWAREVRCKRSPITPLQSLFARFDTPGALMPAHSFLYWSATHAARAIDLGCPCCGRVSEDEALMLAAMFMGDVNASCAAMRGIVAPVALAGAVRLAREFGVELQALA